MKESIILFIFVFLISSHSCSQTKYKLPDPVGYVNDFEKVLTPSQIDTLTTIISEHRKLTTNQIAIVSIDSIAPYKNIFDFSLDLFNTWGIGTKEKNNGVAIIFSTKIRMIRIMVGTGLESKLTDAEAKAIIDNKILPSFKSGNYYQGLKLGLIDIMKEIK